MGKRTLDLNDRLYQYLLEVSLRETPVQAELRRQTDQMEWSRMQVSADQAQFMALLARLVDARRIIEVGTFTGYSALALAQVLPQDGRLIACDISREWTDIASRYWRQAGVVDRIELRLAPALETLDELIAAQQANSFDFAFIDADKHNQLNYYERCLTLLRPGGLIVVDNVLWGGSVADPDDAEADTQAIRRFNDAVKGDRRVDISLVPIGDGVTLARKR